MILVFEKQYILIARNDIFLTTDCDYSTIADDILETCFVTVAYNYAWFIKTYVPVLMDFAFARLFHVYRQNISLTFVS